MNPNKILTELGYKEFAEYRNQWAEMCRWLGNELKNHDYETAIETLTYRYGALPAKEKMGEYKAPVNFIGKEMIPGNLYPQIYQIAELPGVERMSVMPDAHPGIGWAIGSITETENRVFPNAVGVDIACRMHLTVLDVDPDEIETDIAYYAEAMQKASKFGPGGWASNAPDHEVMHLNAWYETPLLRGLKQLAGSQLGTSGGGNHFFDLVFGEVLSAEDWHPFHEGMRFAAIMTHSGSRGTGLKIAKHYQKVAHDYTSAKATGVPKDLAFLDLDTEQGLEYWHAMSLMGEYAKANHEIIHEKFLRETMIYPALTIDNHHNFAWQENGKIVMRKGATPAFEGVPGIIPGSSGGTSIVVTGLGNDDYINSSSHGAGRPFSRSEAKRRWSQDDTNEALRNQIAIGVTPDESPMAYKDPIGVFSAQEGVVFRTSFELSPPRVVIMGGKNKYERE